MILYNFITEENLFKVGFTVSKRVGNAVKRNKCKRLIRALTSEITQENKFRPLEAVIIAKPTMFKEKYSNLKTELTKGLENLR